MSQKGNYKICLVGECLSGGGAEKAMAMLSGFFTANGIDVHIVTVVDSIVYPYSGTLLNLGRSKNNSNDPINKFSRFMKLKAYLDKNRFDYIIDFRIRVSFMQEYLISRILYNSPTIYTVHSSMLDLYFPKSRWQSLAIYKFAAGIVAVSDAIESMIKSEYQLNNTETIHNPVDIQAIQKSALEETGIEYKYILAVGRMKDNIKQFDKLITAYSKSALPEKNIKLVILGDGEDRIDIEKQIAAMHLSQNVILKGFDKNPYPYMKNALFFVLSSKREGLPTVILESLACGTPVVSFDCVSGPREMVIDRKNGLLVDDQNFEKLTEAIDLLANDEVLYENCKRNAVESAERFSLEIIGNQWLEYLKIRKLAP